ncbi:MAG: hypothetical protein U0350_44745 [Caldilineaceae bacterium]
MKPKERTQHHQRFWLIDLTVILILLGQFLTAGAQTPKSKITVTGADDTSAQTLAQPEEFLQSLGISPAQVQQKLKPRPHIVVVGAGFVRNLGMVAFANLKNVQPIKTSIQVQGAGATWVVGLAALPGLQNAQVLTATIQVQGAGSVRGIKLVAPPGQ